jgi:hypothetical protein
MMDLLGPRVRQAGLNGPCLGKGNQLAFSFAPGDAGCKHDARPARVTC